jgi:hypothetical protein
VNDDELSRALTTAVRGVPGVVAVHPPRPIAHAAAELAAAAFALHEPDAVVDIDRHGGALRIVTGIAVADERPAIDTVRAVGERIREVVDGVDGPRADLIDVRVRLVEGM